jgi:hypothetical protein
MLPPSHQHHATDPDSVVSAYLQTIHEMDRLREQGIESSDHLKHRAEQIEDFGIRRHIPFFMDHHIHWH